MTYLLFSKKSSKKHRFSNDFREDKSWFILSNSLNIRCEIGRQSLICEKKQKKNIKAPCTEFAYQTAQLFSAYLVQS